MAITELRLVGPWCNHAVKACWACRQSQNQVLLCLKPITKLRSLGREDNHRTKTCWDSRQSQNHGFLGWEQSQNQGSLGLKEIKEPRPVRTDGHPSSWAPEVVPVYPIPLTQPYWPLEPPKQQSFNTRNIGMHSRFRLYWWVVSGHFGWHFSSLLKFVATEYYFIYCPFNHASQSANKTFTNWLMFNIPKNSVF